MSRSNKRGSQEQVHVKAELGGNKRKRTQQDDSKQLTSLLKAAGELAKNKAEQYSELASSGNTKLSAAEEHALVSKVMRHVLFKHHQQPDVPIPRTDIQAIVKTTTKHQVTSYILHIVRARFASLFGMDMVEVQRKTKPTSGGGLPPAASSGTTSFVLRSLLPSELRQMVLPTPPDGPRRALLLVVLALIRLNMGKMHQDQLLQHLEELGVVVGQQHPELGEVKEALALMVKQRQLFQGKSTGPEGEALFYEWGEQAEEHVEGEALDKWINDLCGIAPRSSFVKIE